jgi:hypothetical protein
MLKYAVPFLLLFAGSHAFALTLSEIRTQVRRNVRDTATDTTLQRYLDATITEYVNEAQREVVNLTWCVEKSTSYVLTAGTTYYDLPSDFLGVQQVTFTDSDSTTFLLKEISEKVQYQTNADFEMTALGQPTQYFTRMPDSGTAMEIAYVPIPDTSASTGTVNVQYAYQPADLSGASDVPFDGFLTLYPYHGALVARATASIKQIEGRNDEAAIYFQLFDRYMAQMKDKNGAMPSYLPSARGTPK